MEILNFKFRYDSDCWVDGYKTSCEHTQIKGKILPLLIYALIAAVFIYLDITLEISADYNKIFWGSALFFIFFAALSVISPVLKKRKMIALYDDPSDNTVFEFKLYDDRFSFEALEP